MFCINWCEWVRKKTLEFCLVLFAFCSVCFIDMAVNFHYFDCRNLNYKPTCSSCVAVSLFSLLISFWFIQQNFPFYIWYECRFVNFLQHVIYFGWKYVFVLNVVFSAVGMTQNLPCFLLRKRKIFQSKRRVSHKHHIWKKFTKYRLNRWC